MGFGPNPLAINPLEEKSNNLLTSQSLYFLKDKTAQIIAFFLDASIICSCVGCMLAKYLLCKKEKFFELSLIYCHSLRLLVIFCCSNLLP